MDNSFQKQNNKKDKNFQKIFINYSIKDGMVKIVSDNFNGQVMSRDSAIQMAESQGLDLIQVSFDKTSKTPICKFGDYGKYRYDLTKKFKNQQKQNRANTIEVKQVQFSLTTEDNDRDRILNQTRKFLNEGCKVKVALRFRNKRESQNMQMAKSLITEFLNQLSDIACLDSKPSVSGRELSCIIKKIVNKV